MSNLQRLAAFGVHWVIPIAVFSLIGYVLVMTETNPDIRRQLKTMSYTMDMCTRGAPAESDPTCTTTATELQQLLNTVHNAEHGNAPEQLRTPHNPYQTRVLRLIGISHRTRLQYLIGWESLNEYVSKEPARSR